MGYAREVAGDGLEDTVVVTRRSGRRRQDRGSAVPDAAADASSDASSGASGDEGASVGLEAVVEAAASGPGGAAGAGGRQLRLNVDDEDRDNPLRPRYTGACGARRMLAGVHVAYGCCCGALAAMATHNLCAWLTLALRRARIRLADFSGNVLADGNEPYNLSLRLARPSSNTSRATPPGGGGHVPSRQPAAGSRMPPPPPRRNPLARQLLPASQPGRPRQQQVQQQQRQQQQQQPSAAVLQSRRDLPGQPRSNAASADDAGTASIPRPRNPRASTAGSSAQRSVRPAPPLPQRQDLRPWQVPTGSAQPAASPVHGATASSGTVPSRLVPPDLRHDVLPRRDAEQSERAPGSHVLQLASRLSLAELRRLCESRGLPSYGTKAQLAARLVTEEQP